jgi:hypothetical protein
VRILESGGFLALSPNTPEETHVPLPGTFDLDKYYAKEVAVRAPRGSTGIWKSFTVSFYGCLHTLHIELRYMQDTRENAQIATHQGPRAKQASNANQHTSTGYSIYYVPLMHTSLCLVTRFSP